MQAAAARSASHRAHTEKEAAKDARDHAMAAISVGSAQEWTLRARTHADAAQRAREEAETAVAEAEGPSKARGDEGKAVAVLRSRLRDALRRTEHAVERSARGHQGVQEKARTALETARRALTRSETSQRVKVSTRAMEEAR